MTLAVVTMVRNEANRFLPAMLEAWRDFADGIVALDDGSSDGTLQLLKNAGAHIATYNGNGHWGEEAGPREALFKYACWHSEFDWLLWLDADMIPATNPRPIFHDSFDAMSFRLYDLWSPEEYREDGYWLAHKHPRIWAIRNPGPDFVPIWNERGIHCGHLPQNLELRRVGLPPLEYSILHYGYSTPQLREAKAAQYASVQNILTGQEIDHARSILDPSPRVLRLPFTPQYEIALAS